MRNRDLLLGVAKHTVAQARYEAISSITAGRVGAAYAPFRPAVTANTSIAATREQYHHTMRNSCSIAAVLTLRVALIGDVRDEASITEKDQHDLSRLLLHRLTVLEAALRRIEELRRGTAPALELGQACGMTAEGPPL